MSPSQSTSDDSSGFFSCSCRAPPHDDTRAWWHTACRMACAWPAHALAALTGALTSAASSSTAAANSAAAGFLIASPSFLALPRPSFTCDRAAARAWAEPPRQRIRRGGRRPPVASRRGAYDRARTCSPCRVTPRWAPRAQPPPPPPSPPRGASLRPRPPPWPPPRPPRPSPYVPPPPRATRAAVAGGQGAERRASGGRRTRAAWWAGSRAWSSRRSSSPSPR
eukprot:1747106-Prymnesium_polylepis.1